jgi:two-component system phosphate regulon sensor histidine kinase PhoR
MVPVRKIKLYRFIEKLALVLLVIWTVGVVILSSTQELATNYVLAIGITFIFLLGIILVVQRAVDSWLEISAAQSGFAENDIFNSLYDRSPVGYLTLDSRGQITKANQAANHLLKIQEGSIFGTSMWDYFLPEEGSNTDVLIGKIKGGLVINDEELPLRTMSGEIIWTIFASVPYRNNGEKLVSLVDVTDQKNIDTAKSEFVALATHQLRTPIAAIRWNVELLERSLREIKTEAQNRYLVKIDRNVHRMIDLINDFLSVSKLEMGTYAADIKEINLTNFFTSIIDEFTEKITEKNINLERKDNPPQLVIKSDYRLLHIIVSNLVSNAVKYLKSEGGLLISYELSGNNLQIQIADDGIGIPESELGNLFTKFYRATNAEAHQTEGTGLGLYIVKQSVEQLGGAIQVVSDTNKGAVFAVDLPVEVVT